MENMSALSRRSFLRHSGLAGAAMLASIACTRQAASTQSGTAAETPTLRLGFNLWAGFMPWQTAKEKNFFQENNLNGELNWFPVLSDQLTAFNSGKLDVAGMTMGDFLTGIVGGVKAKVVSTTDISLGADAIVVAPSINSLQEMAGKTASIEIGTVGHLLFLKALEKGGLPDSAVQITNQAADAAIATLIAGRTQIAYSYEPFVSQAVNAGKGKVIFSSRDVPGLVPDILVVQQSVLDRQPEAVQNLLKVWYQTLDYRKSNLDEVLAIEAKQAGVAVEEYQNLLNGLKWLTPQEAMVSLQPGTGTESQINTA
ncbi:MAG: ABC transporter substrate-binding protein, partial [Microcoleus sp. SIO2G3]|nr:ABC transporter substrate-binding protein [Microcoleus sp. SIO2G3]